MSMISADHLRRLRNDVPVVDVILDLHVESTRRGSRANFRCPDCGRFRLLLHKRENLAHCFSCGKNFNPIDFAMAVGNLRFRDAVRYVERVGMAAHGNASAHPNEEGGVPTTAT